MIIKVQKQLNELITESEFLEIAEYQDGNGILRESTDRGVYRDWETDRKSTRLNSSHSAKSRMPSSA